MHKIPLIQAPTPLHKLISFQENNVYAKRDDMTDLALGGNKARKAEYYLADAIECGCSHIVTYGSTESNHCRIVAAGAAKLGFSCTLVLSEPSEPPSYDGNFFMYDLLGANIVYAPVERVSVIIDETMEKLRSKGENPYFIPGGGHGNLGTHAYVKAYEELEEQKRSGNLWFDYIFLASGTGTTQAGILIGSRIFDHYDEQVIGISVARSTSRGEEVIRESICDYIAEYDLDVCIRCQDVILIDGYVGGGYGVIYPEVVDTVRRVARCEGIILDPVYTGKAFWGMMQYVAENELTGKNILFWHTGGIPLFFSHRDSFRNHD